MSQEEKRHECDRCRQAGKMATTQARWDEGLREYICDYHWFHTPPPKKDKQP